MPSSANAPGGRRRPKSAAGKSRRQFLKEAAVLSAAVVASRSADAAEEAEPKLPRIRLGKYAVSRLICGANPFNAGSHLSVFVNQEMRRYYTPEQVIKTLRRCQAEGVNCWQSGPGNLHLYRRFIDEGGKMHFLAIASGRPTGLKKLAEAGTIGVAHHGEVTDRMFRSGKLDPMNDYLKAVRDAGILVGVSTHMPDVVDAVESKGWDVDFYMTCVYERHRSEDALKELLGHVPIPLGEVYLADDPPRMFQAMRQTKRPCLAFKILAAGRLSDRREWVDRAFRETFASIKPNDAVIVGIYDRYSDQVAENARFVRRYGSPDPAALKTRT